MTKHFQKSLSIFLVLVILTSFIPINSHAQDIAAQAAVAIDYETGLTLYEKDADKLMVPASMTKVLTVFIAFQEIEAGNLSMDTKIKVSPKNAALSTNRNYPANVRLVAGNSYTVDHLIKLILLPSASASCIVLAEHISGSEANFVKRMNQTMQDLNLEGEFFNCHGAQINYITPKSMALLIRTFIQRYPTILDYTSLKSVYHEGRDYKNTDGLITGEYYYPGVDGFKTGTIPAAGHCLASTAKVDGERVITVAMKSSNNKTRHTDTITLLDAGFKNLPKLRESIRSTKLEILNTPKEIRLNSDYKFEVGVSGVETPYRADLIWELNGEVIGKQKNVFIQNDRNILFDFVTNELYDTYNLTVRIDLPDTDISASTGDRPASEKEAALFRDVNTSNIESQINRLYNLGITKGYNEEYYGVNEKVTRGMFITSLGRLTEHFSIDTVDTELKSGFTDIKEKDYFFEYANWAENLGIIKGSDGKFKANEILTREEMASILYRYLNEYEIEIPEVEHTPGDLDEVSPWAKEGVEGLYNLIFKSISKDNKFKPQNEVTRSEMARTLVDFIDNFIE